MTETSTNSGAQRTSTHPSTTSTSGISRRLLSQSGLAAIGAGALGYIGSSMPASAATTSNTPASLTVAKTRTLSAGYETVTNKDAVTALASFVNTINVGNIAISAGRADWATFRWTGHESDWSFRSDQPNGDPFADAVAALAPNKSRNVTAIVDVLVGRSNATRSVRADGTRIDNQVSLAALDGYHGKMLTDMCSTLASMPAVTAINLTELQYDDGGYGIDDLRLFQSDTGLKDWPRDSRKNIMTTSPVIGAWRSMVVARSVKRIADAVHAKGKKLIVDVRAPGKDDLMRTISFGLDYLRLLNAGADRLGVWYYFDGTGLDIAQSAVLDILRAISPDRVVVEVGLWGPGGQPMSQDSLTTVMKQVDASGFTDVWVTPASLLTDGTKTVLQKNWS